MTTFPRSLLILALLFTGLNAVKPLVIDDAAYFYYARQIAQHPLDPYGFDILWYDSVQTANSVLAPPVFLYWFAAAVRLFGESPVLWKLWLFPIALLFTAALHDLFRRFAAGLAGPLTWMTVLSPAFLPGFNLMLDVPALTLSLTATALFLRAIDRDSLVLATAAGLIAGLGMQTKYTGVTTPAVMLAAAVVWSRPRLWLPAAITALNVFFAWELITALLYGQSHFFAALRSGAADADLTKRLHQKARLILPLIGNLGSVAPALVLLMMTAAGASTRRLAIVAGALVLPFLLIAAGSIYYAKMRTDHVLLIALGLFGAGGAAAAAWRMRERLTGRPVLFLAVWFLLEGVAYFPLSPFPAVRRVQGLFVVASLLAGHLAATALTETSRRRVGWAVAFSVLLAVGVYAIDLHESLTEKIAAEHAVARARQLGEGEVWYVGHWGFQHYAEAAGARPVVPYVSELRPGDVVIVPASGRVYQQEIDFATDQFEEAERFEMVDYIPWRTVWTYYSGYGTVEHHGPFYLMTQDSAPATLTWQDVPHGSYSRLGVVIHRVRRAGRTVLAE